MPSPVTAVIGTPGLTTEYVVCPYALCVPSWAVARTRNSIVSPAVRSVKSCDCASGSAALSTATHVPPATRSSMVNPAGVSPAQS